MDKEITVDRAIKKRTHLLIAMLIIGAITIYLLLAMYVYCVTRLNLSYWLTLIIIFFIILAEGSLMFFAMSSWKVWAFKNVRDVQELKRRLIMLNIVSENSTFFKKVENSTEDDKKYWDIRLKFAQEDIFLDDESIFDETVIYFSKTKSKGLMIFSTLLFALGMLMAIIPDEEKESAVTLFGIFFLIIAVIGFFREYTKLNKKEPQLILSNEGIKTTATFYKWGEIEDEKIAVSGSGASASKFLTFQHPSGKESIYILDLGITDNKLSKLLVLYRKRSRIEKVPNA